MSDIADRESLGELPNPVGLAGIEFVEYATARPQALGRLLESIGFVAVARHRSREVTLYRQGAMNLVVNSHARAGGAEEAPVIAAVALRVRDAAAAYQRALDRGAWAVPVQVQPMELHIPAIHGVASSRIYFVDRWQGLSIYDVDFVPIAGAPRQPVSPADLRWFGLVQYIGNERTADWTGFYEELLGFRALPEGQRFGILPKGRMLQSPCGTFYLQLIEPEPGILEVDDRETLARVAFGTPDVLRAVALLRARGVEFVEAATLHSDVRGALTMPALNGVTFEFVRTPA